MQGRVIAGARACSSAPCRGFIRLAKRWEDGRANPERQADSFASELLLPSAELLKQIGDQWPSFQLVISLAEFFGASLTATSRKYCEIAPQECAVVWSVGGIIKWMHPASRFRHWVTTGSALSSSSIARRMLDGENFPPGMQEIPAEAWISSFYLLEGASIWEESRSMPNYKGCLSLLWAKREIRYRDPAQDRLLQRSTPGNLPTNGRSGRQRVSGGAERYEYRRRVTVQHCAPSLAR